MTSYVQNANAPMLPASYMYDFYRECISKLHVWRCIRSFPSLASEKYGGPPDDPEVSPFLCTTLADLPPAYIQVCGLDPLRDEALVYAKKLDEHGVPTRVDT